MYKIVLQAKARSKARIRYFYGRNTFVVGKKYDAVYKISNVGDEIFPGGYISITVSWPNGQQVFHSMGVESLQQNKSVPKEIKNCDVLAPGFALFFAKMTAFKKNGTIEDVALFQSPDLPIPRGPDGMISSFFNIYGIDIKEIYSFWAMIISASSLAIIAGEIIIRFLLSLFFPAN